ncbi:MAG TPA: septum formation initiator family protein [Acidimicrobiales bacterium]|nr:septum formation initiator family protein [Acidimicrobiales bacterium]
MLTRARVALLASVVLASLLLVLEVPLGQLTGARSAAAATAAELSKVQRENEVLARQIDGLEHGPMIEEIAHEEFGLVGRDQRSVVVMPGGTGTARVHGGSTAPGGGLGTAPLGSSEIPPSDLVPSDAAVVPAGSQSHPQSFWQRFLDRLEFWKGSV